VSELQSEMVEALIKHAEGHISKHVVNAKVYMSSAVGVAEHPDIIESIEKELNIISEYHDQIEMLKKYF